jgi:hypothetical protein
MDFGFDDLDPTIHADKVRLNTVDVWFFCEILARPFPDCGV